MPELRAGALAFTVVVVGMAVAATHRRDQRGTDHGGFSMRVTGSLDTSNEAMGSHTAGRVRCAAPRVIARSGYAPSMRAREVP